MEYKKSDGKAFIDKLKQDLASADANTSVADIIAAIEGIDLEQAKTYQFTGHKRCHTTVGVEELSQAEPECIREMDDLIKEMDGDIIRIRSKIHYLEIKYIRRS
jgi:hypothetical protein